MGERAAGTRHAGGSAPFQLISSAPSLPPLLVDRRARACCPEPDREELHGTYRVALVRNSKRLPAGAVAAVRRRVRALRAPPSRDGNIDALPIGNHLLGDANLPPCRYGALRL